MTERDERDILALQRILGLLDQLRELTYSADGRAQVQKLAEEVQRQLDEVREDALSRPYQPDEVEEKWQDRWEDDHINEPEMD